MKKYILFGLVLIYFSLSSNINAATFTAANCNAATLQALHDDSGTHDGDTIVIPAGTCKWTTSVTFTKALTWMGSGTVSLDVHGNANGNSTIIQDDLEGGNAGYNPLWTMTAVANKLSRITNIEFDDGGRTPLDQWGIINIGGANDNGSSIRIDHCFFNQLNGSAVNLQSVIGVFDHNGIYSTHLAYNIRIFDATWNGGAGQQFGDRSYADSSNFGSGQFIFIEHNTITLNYGFSYACLDGIYATRLVIRYNSATQCGWSFHGTETGGRVRGTRAYEIYRNTEDFGGLGGNPADFRSGTGFVFQDTLTNAPTTLYGSIVDDRMSAALSPWEQADGTNQWDINLAGGPFETKTVSSAGMYTATVSGAPWTTDQWAGYSIKKVATPVAGLTQASEIVSNTSNTITFGSSDAHGPNLSFTTGDTFEIYKVLYSLDQPGRTGGSIINGGDPVLPSGWNDQVTEPIYAFLNLNDGTQIDVGENPNCPQCTANKIYYNTSATFNGTVGIGSGVRASRPATCTTGVAYWSTNIGSWNLSSDGGQGVLDKCTATNTWTDNWYVPYTYPHPLIGYVPAGSSFTSMPPSGIQSQTITLTIVGTNTTWINGNTTVNFSGAGITVNSVTVTDSTHLTVSISLSPAAAAGSRDITITTGH